MKTFARRPRRTRGLDSRGIALPLALLGLIAISLLVTTTVLTSSTEVALSNAHQDGVASLYKADAVLEQFIVTSAAADSARLGPTSVNSTYGGDAYVTKVALMRQEDLIPAPDSPDSMQRNETLSIVTVRNQSAGRGVSVLIDAVRRAKIVNLNINAATTSGGNMTVSGSRAVISNESSLEGPDGQKLCTDTADAALQVTAGSTVTINGNPTIDGAVDTLTMTKDQMTDSILNGIRIRELAASADIKLNATAFNGNRPNSSFLTTTADSVFNWGCPLYMGIDCSNDMEDADRWPIVAIDAENGEVFINGDFGQGMLIVYNGSLRLQGNFIYKGTILVEGDLRVGGGTGGAFGGKLEGAVVAMGSDSEIADRVEGGAIIHYNKCANDRAQQGLNDRRLDSAQQRFTRSYGWSEVMN